MTQFGNIGSQEELAGKNNLSALVAPTTTDDSNLGYEVGSTWVDTNTNKAYVCVDASVGAAIWTETTQSSSGSSLSETSGLIDGAVLSVNGGDNTKFDLSSGSGQVVDAKTTPATPTITPVTIAGGTAITVTNLATQFFTYILVDDLGAIVQQGTPPTSIQLRTHIYIGKLNHANQTNLASAVNAPSLAIGTSSGLEDLMLEAIGVINATPMVVSSGGANLNIDISAGDLWQLGINYDGDKNKPHTLSYATYDSSVVPFVYVTSDTVLSAPTNVLIPGSYESPLGTVTAVGANNWTNQRVYKTLTGNVLLMYGQTEYNSKALALEGLYNETHVTPDILTSGEAILIGIITINQGATDTSDSAEVVFQQASKFGEFGKGSAGVSTGNLQNSYDNSIEPEILTDDVRGALSIRRGSTGGDTDIVWEILNGAGDIVATIDGNGTLSSGGITGSTGLLTGGVLSVGTGGPGVATTFSISDGTGEVIDSNGVRSIVSWTGLTDEALTFLATNLITFIGINSAGAIVQQTGPFTALQSRSIIVLGVVVHVNFTTVDTVNNEQHISYNTMSSVYDLAEAIGFFNVSGNVFSANGANLNLDKSVGDIFKMGSNYDTDINNPHVRNLAVKVATQFQYRFSDGTSGPLTDTNVDPDNLDDGAGGTTAVGNNRWSVQRIYVFTSNNVKLQRGVQDYATLDAAVNGISTEPYITEPSIAANGLFRGWLVIKKGATDLSDGAEALFLAAPKFGETGSASAGTVTDWHMPPMNLGDGATSGVSLFASLGGGVQYVFDGGSDDSWICNYNLRHNDVEYDGSDLEISMWYQLSVNGGVSDDIDWEVKYQFLNEGDDSDAAGTTFVETIDVSSRVTGNIYKDVLTTKLTGVAGKKIIGISISRLGDVGGDTYSGDIWVLNFQLKKV